MLKNKTIIITGASSGIGAAIARRLSRAGANVVLFARRADRLATLCAELDNNPQTPATTPACVAQTAKSADEAQSASPNPKSKIQNPKSLPHPPRPSRPFPPSALQPFSPSDFQNFSPSELQAFPSRSLAIAGDVTLPADRERLVRATLEKFGRVDALVNNAGYGQRGPLERIPLDALRANFETNVFSLVALTQLIAPLMRAQGAGRIVNIGSIAGRITRPLSCAYDSTKFAIEGITSGLRAELKPFGIQVVLVRPGFIHTEFGQVAETISAPMLSPDGAGPYAPYVNYFEANRARMRRVAGAPDDIARLVEKALAARRPRRSYNAPLHAKFFLLLNWLLPACVLDWILRMKRA